MSLMNFGFCDKDRISGAGMVEIVAEGTPLIRVPRDSKEEALLICEAKNHQILEFQKEKDQSVVL